MISSFDEPAEVTELRAERDAAHAALVERTADYNRARQGEIEARWMWDRYESEVDRLRAGIERIARLYRDSSLRADLRALLSASSVATNQEQ